jgi:altronate dehydratase large subunit
LEDRASKIIQGYRRSNGSVGIRNHVLILPSVVCATETASRIAARVKGAVTLIHQHGCTQIGRDAEQTLRTLTGVARNPNVAATLVVGLGCETIGAEKILRLIEREGRPAEMLNIQDEHSTLRTTKKGVSIAKRMVVTARKTKREPLPLRKLIVGLECGGSDMTSGIAANPALGVASDAIVHDGGTTILSETTEFIGAEHILAERGSSPHVKKRIYEITHKMERRLKAAGVDFLGAQPTPGNIRGGLTTLEEKSLGCIYKAGTASVQEVLEYAEKPRKKGLVIMDTPGQDVESIAGMIAGGAQLIAFTTGQGTPVGCPIAPVIKITGNPRTYKTMKEHIDIDAGVIVEGKDTVASVGKRIFDEVIKVSSGKRTKSEKLGHREFAITRIGSTF